MRRADTAKEEGGIRRDHHRGPTEPAEQHPNEPGEGHVPSPEPASPREPVQEVIERPCGETAPDGATIGRPPPDGHRASREEDRQRGVGRPGQLARQAVDVEIDSRQRDHHPGGHQGGELDEHRPLPQTPPPGSAGPGARGRNPRERALRARLIGIPVGARAQARPDAEADHEADRGHDGEGDPVRHTVAILDRRVGVRDLGGPVGG